MNKLFSLLLLINITILGQSQNLVPAPKKIVQETDTGYFTLDKTFNIFVKDSIGFNIEDLTNALKSYDISHRLFAKHTKNTNLVLEVEPDSLELQKIYDREEAKHFDIGDEGYVILVKPDKIKLYAATNAGLFYGIQTFKQIISFYSPKGKIPCMVIYDKPDIPIRAWQDDISRGPIPSMEMLKKQIQTMASFKLNYFTLYTEHVFRLDKHPEISPKDGITKSEIKELAEFAKKHHVTLIGNYQSFGHMEETLCHPSYKHLAENSHIISPAIDESYKFLSDVYEEIVPQYDGEYFNINCDETFGLGEGKSKKMVDSMGISGVYTYHINKLNDLLKKYNKKILMWGDIATSYPEITPNLPKDITVIAWGYHPAKSFDYAITPIYKQGLNFWVAPGINCWSNIFPNLQATKVNVYNFIRDGVRFSTSGVLNTSWDDDGLNFFNNNWHGMAWGAENCWNAPPYLPELKSDIELIERYDEFNEAFDTHFFGLNDSTKSITRLMHEFSLLHESNIRSALKNSRFFEAIFPIHNDYVQDGKKEKNIEALEMLDSIAKEINSIEPQIKTNKEALEYFTFALNQTKFTLRKNLFRINLHHYLEEKSNATKDEIKGELAELIAEIKTLKQQYIKLWEAENRSYWLDINERKFNTLIISLETIGAHVIIEPSNEISKEGRKINIRSVFNELPIRYTINEDTVTFKSPFYKGPIYINENSSIAACTFDNMERHPIQRKNIIHHKAIGSLLKLNSICSEYHPSYNGGGKYALIDGLVANKNNLYSGKWQGFSGQDIDIEIDFKEEKQLNTFEMGFYQDTHSWVIFPKKVEIYIKNKLEDEYQLHKTIPGKIAPEEKGKLKDIYGTTLDSVNTRYIRVIAKYYGKLPEWHHAGSNYESMIFADEIIIE